MLKANEADLKSRAAKRELDRKADIEFKERAAARKRQIAYELSRVTKEWIPAIEVEISKAAMNGERTATWKVDYTMSYEATKEIEKIIKEAGYAKVNVVSKECTSYDPDWGHYDTSYTQATVAW